MPTHLSQSALGGVFARSHRDGMKASGEPAFNVSNAAVSA